MSYILFGLISVYTIFTFWFAVSSLKEKVLRAAIIGFGLSLLMAGGLGVYAWVWWSGLLASGLMQGLQIAAIVILVVSTVLFFAPLGRRPLSLAGTRGMREADGERFNQKETIFNIAHVGGFGPEISKQRWALQSRDPFRGLYWTLAAALRAHVDGKVNPEKKELTPQKITKEIKRTARYLGADLVGVTTVKDDFIYSDGFSYEESKLEVGPAVTHPIDLKHKYVIVLAKEMSFERIENTLTANNDESLGEIGKTYFELAQIACGLAAYIRGLGYSARAHHIRSEQIFQIPHAIDAGIGEQGRHGFIMTKEFGPRVRLASVTTDMELVEDKPVDIGVQDFCEICRLCEINCPSASLSSEKAVIRGYRKWPHGTDTCFDFWVSGGNTFGCTMCLKVCPWNKPRSFVHKIAFFAVSRSLIARRAMYWITVIFYGKKIRWTKLPLPANIELPPEVKAWVDRQKSSAGPANADQSEDKS